MKTFLILLFTILPVAASSIVGGWVRNAGVADDSAAIVFLENGTYFHFCDGSRPVDLFEKGSYTWNAETSQLDLVRTSRVGDIDDLLATSFDFTIQGNSALDGEFQKVQSTELSSIIGPWFSGSGEPAESGTALFLPNGIFFAGKDGVARGTYTYDPETSSLSTLLTSSSDGGLGISDHEEPVQVAILGDSLSYKPGLLNSFYTRATPVSSSERALNESIQLSRTTDGYPSIFYKTKPGFFYTLERSFNLSNLELVAALQGVNDSGTVLTERSFFDSPPRRIFYMLSASPQKTPSSADFNTMLTSLDGLILDSGTERWTQGGESGLWKTVFFSDSVRLTTIDESAGTDFSDDNRTVYLFDFSEVTDLTRIPVEVTKYTVGVPEVSQIFAYLGDPPTTSLVPTPTEFASKVGGMTIQGINFSSDNRWESFGREGNWSYRVIGIDRATLTFTTDRNGNDPALERDVWTLTFENFSLSVQAIYFENNAASQPRIFGLDLDTTSFIPEQLVIEQLISNKVLPGAFSEYSFQIVAGDELNTLTRMDESGFWAIEPVDQSQATIIMIFREDGPGSPAFGEDILLTFDGTTEVSWSHERFNGSSPTTGTMTLELD